MRIVKYLPIDILALVVSIHKTFPEIEGYIKNEGINIIINNTLWLQNNSGLILSQFDPTDCNIYIYNLAISEFLNVTNKKLALMPDIYKSCLAHELFHYLEYIGELKPSHETNTLSSEKAARYFSELVTGLNLSEQ